LFIRHGRYLGCRQAEACQPFAIDLNVKLFTGAGIAQERHVRYAHCTRRFLSKVKIRIAGQVSAIPAVVVICAA